MEMDEFEVDDKMPSFLIVNEDGEEDIAIDI